MLTKEEIVALEKSVSEFLEKITSELNEIEQERADEIIGDLDSFKEKTSLYVSKIEESKKHLEELLDKVDEEIELKKKEKLESYQKMIDSCNDLWKI